MAAGRVGLAGRILMEYLRVLHLLRKQSLREVAAPLLAGDRVPEEPARLSRGVTRVLGRVAGERARCIHRALVLQRLLTKQGDPALLVLGLPEAARDERAHAWVELHGADVGPAPGRGRHLEMARYGGNP